MFKKTQADHVFFRLQTTNVIIRLRERRETIQKEAQVQGKAIINKIILSLQQVRQAVTNTVVQDAITKAYMDLKVVMQRQRI